MTTSSTTHPTMIDYYNRVDGKGDVAQIIEIIRQENPLLDVLPWAECNDGSRHMTSLRTGYSAPTWRKLYGGVQPGKSTTRKVYDSTGLMHKYAEVDVDLVQQNGNSSAWRMSENSAHLDAMNEEFMSTFFYGNETDEPEAFTGISARYNDAGAENGRQIIKVGTTPDTSFWVLGFGPQAISGIYPKGFNMGLEHNDKGQVTLEDADGSNGGRMEIYRSHYRWACGITLRDWRTCARVQVDYSELEKDAASGPNLFDELSKALARTKRGGATRRVIVCNEGILEFFRLQAKYATQNSTLSRGELAGRDVDMIDGNPVLMCDALTTTEDTLAPIAAA